MKGLNRTSEVYMECGVGAPHTLDWNKLEDLMAGIYAGKTGRPSYPLLTLLRASLLGI
jgi:IS5 family transposase